MLFGGVCGGAAGVGGGGLRAGLPAGGEAAFWVGRDFGWGFSGSGAFPKLPSGLKRLPSGSEFLKFRFKSTTSQVRIDKKSFGGKLALLEMGWVARAEYRTGGRCGERSKNRSERYLAGTAGFRVRQKYSRGV